MKASVACHLLCLLAALGMALATILVFAVAPTHPEQGFIQKIFYFHVPSAWAMFLGALVGAVGSAAHLFRDARWGDDLAAAAAELTVVFGVIVLATGPLWARKAWGHYWVWDVRLTTVLVLFLIFVAVLLARRYGGPARRRIAAGLTLFGAADVPLIYVSVKLWRTTHPGTAYVGSLSAEARPAFAVSLVAFTLLFLCLLWIRLGLERGRNRLDALALAIAENEDRR